MKILLLPLDFLAYENAGRLSYPIGLGLEEGLAAAGAEVVTIPTYLDVSPARGWLAQARELCAGQTFDQVWFEVVHSQLDDSTLDWLMTLAPVRVGIVVESLVFDPRQWSTTTQRRLRAAHRRMPCATHLVMADEADVGRVNAEGRQAAFYWPGGLVPRRYVGEAPGPPELNLGLFSGALYGERRRWLARPDLAGVVALWSGARERESGLASAFDARNAESLRLLEEGADARPLLSVHLAAMRAIRRQCFALWLEDLRTGCAVVNLPQHGQAYSSRVVEGMAAGRPVVSWEIPDRPLTRALFEPGEEILLYSQDRPEELAEHVRRLQGDPGEGRRIAENARKRILRDNTTEVVVPRIVRWAADGVERPRVVVGGGIRAIGPAATAGPAVSVVVTTQGRRGAALGRALASARGQTLRDLEIVLVNDGGERIEEAGGRIRQVQLPAARGTAGARNAGLATATGRWVAYLDDDDVLEPTHLERLVEALAGQGAAVAYSDFRRVHRTWGQETVVREDRGWSLPYGRGHLEAGQTIFASCVMHERALAEEEGGFDESLSALEDWDLLLRYARQRPFVRVPEATCLLTWWRDAPASPRDASRRAIQARHSVGSAGPWLRVIWSQIAPLVEDLARQDPSEAQREAEDFIARFPGCSAAHNMLGVLHHLRGQPQAAVIALERAMSLDPADPEPRCNLSALNLSLGHFEAALAVLAAVFENRPDHPEALLLAGDINTALGRPADAADFYRLLLQRDPRHELASARLAALAAPSRQAALNKGRSLSDER